MAKQAFTSFADLRTIVRTTKEVDPPPPPSSRRPWLSLITTKNVEAKFVGPAVTEGVSSIGTEIEYRE